MQYNPIGHPAPWDLVEPILNRTKKLVEKDGNGYIRRVLLEGIASANLHEAKDGVPRLWDQLKAFLTDQLAPCFEAFRASDEWRLFDPSSATRGEDSTEELSSLQSAAAASDAADAASGKTASAVEGEKPSGTSASDSFADYVPAKLTFGPAHVEHVVESASLACVAVTDITFELSLPQAALTTGVLSRVQVRTSRHPPPPDTFSYLLTPCSRASSWRRSCMPSNSTSAPSRRAVAPASSSATARAWAKGASWRQSFGIIGCAR